MQSGKLFKEAEAIFKNGKYTTFAVESYDLMKQAYTQLQQEHEKEIHDLSEVNGKLFAKYTQLQRELIEKIDGFVKTEHKKCMKQQGYPDADDCREIYKDCPIRRMDDFLQSIKGVADEKDKADNG